MKIAVPGTRGVTSGARASEYAIAEWIIHRELLWLALLSPFFLFPSRAGVVVLAALPALWIARRIARGRFLPNTPLDWPIVLLVGMLLVSLFATYSVEYSLGKVMGLLFGIGIFYALVDWAITDQRLKWLVWGFLAGGVALSLLGLLGTNWAGKPDGAGIPVSGPPLILRGLPGAENGFHPNEVGGALLWIVLPAAALLIWAWSARPICSRRERAVLSFVFLLSLGTLLATQSRAVLIATFVGLVLLLYLLVARLRRWLIVALPVAVLALVAFLVSSSGALITRLLEPVAGDPVSDPAHMRARVEIWSSALAAIRDAPLTGIGMNTFRQIMPRRYPSSLVPPDYDVVHAHNIFLQTALDLGLPGMLAHIAIWVIVGVLLVRAWRAERDNWSRALTAGVAAALLAFLVFGITDTIALGAKPGVYFWACLAMAVLLYQRSAGTTPKRV